MPDQVDFRRGLRLDDLTRVDIRQVPLQRGATYLAFSRQKITLPDNVIGLLHTRSSLSRLGLDFFGSSIYVSPGFGAERPTPIVFEITATITIKNLPSSDHVAGLVLYQVDGVDTVWRGRGHHTLRFPFVDMKPRTEDEQ